MEWKRWNFPGRTWASRHETETESVSQPASLGKSLLKKRVKIAYINHIEEWRNISEDEKLNIDWDKFWAYKYLMV